jgi:mannitol 2-dehydrogenase
MLNTLSTIKLNAGSLGKLPASIARPGYDRSKVRPGLVHVSLGAFHRAHQTVYTDDLLAAQGAAAAEWGYCSVGALPNDEQLCRRLNAQDTLYTVVTRDQEGMKPRVIGSIVEVLHSPSDPGAVLNRMADKGTKIVSLTVTERGYGHNPATGKLDTGRSDVAADLAIPQRPKTALGMVVEALYRRREDGLPPFTVMSCDNLQKNGTLTRALTLELADRRDPELARWIEANGAFPNTMVDRITPATTAEDVEQVRKSFGIEDSVPVVCEPFRQWVLEDQFCNGRPAWEEVGAQIVSDVYPYELTKLRLLNVVHSAFCYPGYLAAYDYVHEAITDPDIQRFVRRLMNEEITPTLPHAPGMDLPAYKNKLIERFANPSIRDGLLRICMDGSQKIGNQMIPIVRDRLEQGGSIEMLCFAIAAFIRYCRGKDEQGKPIEIRDPLTEELRRAAQAGGSDPRPFLGLEVIFGKDLPAHDGVVKGVTDALAAIDAKGMKQAVSAL